MVRQSLEGTELKFMSALNLVKFHFVLLHFAEAEGARDGLNGRFFGGRKVQATLYDQDLFDHNDYSG